MGKYLYQYKDENDKMQSVTIPIDWAEMNFGVVLLPVVQEFAYEKGSEAHNKYKNENGKTCPLS